MADIRIVINKIQVAASLDLTSKIGRSIFDSLPMTVRFERWGDEICFPLDQGKVDLRSPVTSVQLGDIAYSDQWKSFCIFYGKTPLSTEHDIVPNGPVEVIGRLREVQSAQVLKRFFSSYLTRITRRICLLFSPSSGYGDTITLEKIETPTRTVRSAA
jgi:hypothetical protein